jgi:putative SOS response-associated peptidase YedK
LRFQNALVPTGGGGNLVGYANAAMFGMEIGELPASYNIAPSQSVAVWQPDTEPQFHWLRWGLIPAWAKDPKIGYKLINARAETIAEKPSFRTAFRQRRCLILADGFYEWQQVEGSRHPHPYFIGMSDERPFAFAGLYERWESPDGEKIDSCTIVTTAANEVMAPIHNSAVPTLRERMPVILAPQEYAQWLDPGCKEIDRLQALLDPYPAAEIKIYPASTLVNSPKNNSPACKYPE